MTLPQAWMLQAESDYRAAKRVDNDADARTRCQALSKYQQCVEKAVKGILDKLNDAGISNAHSDSRHQVARYIAVFVNIPRTNLSGNLLNQLANLFPQRVLEQIDFLDSLVPQYPPRGALAAKNHEYPFQLSLSDWRAPTDENVFTNGEMKRVRNCVGSLIQGLRKIFDALESLFP